MTTVWQKRRSRTVLPSSLHDDDCRSNQSGKSHELLLESTVTGLPRDFVAVPLGLELKTQLSEAVLGFSNAECRARSKTCGARKLCRV